MMIRRHLSERRRQAQLHKLNRTLKALSHSNQAIMRARNEAGYLQDVCGIVVEDCGYAMVWIGLAENDRNKTVRPIAQAGFDEGYLESLRVTWADTEHGRGPTGTAIRTGKPSMCRNMLTDPKFAPWRSEALRRGYSSSLALPLLDGDEVLGAITIYSGDPDSFSHDDIKLLTELANDLAYGIAAIRLRDENARMRAEAEARAAQLESFIANTAYGVALFDAEGNTVIMNDAGRAVLGAGPDLTLEAWNWDYQRISLGGAPFPAEEGPTCRALRGETIIDARYRIIAPNGKEAVISMSACPVLDAEGCVTGATNIFRDVTNEVEIERRNEEILQRERRIAQILQDAILPPQVPERLLGHSIAVRYRPALHEAEIGGDFYDVFDLGDGRFAVLIGDVAGKGLPAAMQVAAARHAIRSYAYIDPAPAKVIELANEALCRAARDEVSMLTAIFALVDTEAGLLTFASAGHQPPVICKARGICEEMEIGGIPIGIMRGVEYTQASYHIGPGDTVVLMTDGITEARTSGSGLFGQDRVLELVSASHSALPDEIASRLLDAATDHAGGHLQDDAAIVVIRREWEAR